MKKSISSADLYNTAYFRSERCEGFNEYVSGRLSQIKLEEIRLMNITRDDKVLDIGCGRGDIVDYLCNQHIDFTGIDYSDDAIKMARSRLPRSKRNKIIKADAREIPLRTSSFSKIIVGDVIEHMTYTEALKVINEAYRLLRKNGQIVIHTAPNLLFKKYTYRLIRRLIILMGYSQVTKKLDENIKATYIYHIDEYTVWSLKRLMKKSKFRSNFKVWLYPDILRTQSKNYLNPIKKNQLIILLSRIIYKSLLINWFGNDLFVSASK